MKWPSHVEQALKRLDYTSETGEAAIASFVEHWGGVDHEALVQAVRHAQGEERILAIWMLKELSPEEAGSELMEALDSLERRVRWQSALCLAELEDRRVLHTLAVLLTEDLPSGEQYSVACLSRDRIEVVRSFLPDYLGAAGVATFAPALRRALDNAIRIEAGLKTTVDENWNDDMDFSMLANGGSEMAAWTIENYEDRLVYALGRLGSLGALTGVAVGLLPEGTLRLARWRVHLVMGHLRDRYHWDRVVFWEDAAGLREMVAEELEKRFGLGQEERQEALALYQRNGLARISTHYLT